MVILLPRLQGYKAKRFKTENGKTEWERNNARVNTLTYASQYTVGYNKTLYISDGCCTKCNIYYYILYLFKLLMILFSFQWCLPKATFFWKTMLVVIYAKILHNRFIPTIYENFKSVFFYLFSANENSEACIQV